VGEAIDAVAVRKPATFAADDLSSGSLPNTDSHPEESIVAVVERATADATLRAWSFQISERVGSL
jgi:hypothetical protein